MGMMRGRPMPSQKQRDHRRKMAAARWLIANTDISWRRADDTEHHGADWRIEAEEARRADQ